MFAQGMDVYRLLIGAIIGSAIFAIVVSIIDQLNSQKVNVSIQQIERALITAYNSPTGDKIKLENIVFKDIFLSKKGLASKVALQKDCIFFNYNTNLDAFEENSQGLKIKSWRGKIFIYCISSNYGGSSCSCDVCCYVEFR